MSDLPKVLQQMLHCVHNNMAIGTRRTLRCVQEARGDLHNTSLELCDLWVGRREGNSELCVVSECLLGARGISMRL
jgi:hypothetical protein